MIPVSLRARVRFLAGASLIALVAGACGSGGDGTPVASGAAVEGRTFLSTSVTGRDLVPGTQIRLTFESGNVNAYAGCNHLGARYSLGSSTLDVGDDGMSMTEIGCDPARHDQDEWLAGFLLSSPSVEVAGDTLVLARQGVVIELLDREVADPDRPLVGTTWVVDSVISGDAVSSVPDGGRVTLELHDDSSFRVEAEGCTAGSGNVEIGEDELVFAPFAVDGVACPGPWNETLAVLGAGGTSYTIDAARLTIRAGNRGISLRAQ